MFDRLPRDVALVGEVPEDGIVGFCRVGAARPPHFGMTGEVGAIYLLPEHWGRGLGRRLMGSGADALERLGFGSAVVWVLTENPARGFYERLGGLRRGTTVHRMAGAEFGVTAYIWPRVRRLSERCAASGSDAGGPPE